MVLIAALLFLPPAQMVLIALILAIM